jgi:hypothetical protein
MKHNFTPFAALALSLMGGVLAPAVKADEWDKKTNITINQPIKVQDTVLPAGSYVIKLLDSPSDRYIVQIFNAEENHLIKTVFTVPVLKSHAPDSSEFKFYESESGQPAALHTWFYPGESTGYEFRAGREGVAPAPSIADAMPSTKVGS